MFTLFFEDDQYGNGFYHEPSRKWAFLKDGEPIVEGTYSEGLDPDEIEAEIEAKIEAELGEVPEYGF